MNYPIENVLFLILIFCIAIIFDSKKFFKNGYYTKYYQNYLKMNSGTISNCLYLIGTGYLIGSILTIIFMR